jgi:NADH dehydrogenase
MTIQTIGVLGGTGFIGGHLVNRLTRDGYSVRLLTRNAKRAHQFQSTASVEVREVSDFDTTTLAQALSGCQAVINLVGILNGSPEAFDRVHAQLPAHVVAAAAQTGASHYLHMSALNANAEHGPSEYLKSKGRGEAAALAGSEQGLHVSSLQPSVVFGPGDSFFNRFAGLLKFSPMIPLACPNARFAPVYVGDVVEAFMRTLTRSDTAGQCYELCGPKIYTLKELVEYTAELTGRKRFILGLPDGLSRLQAKVFERLPGQPFTTDNYLSMQVDSVCRRDGLAELGITPHAAADILPPLLAR